MLLERQFSIKDHFDVLVSLERSVLTFFIGGKESVDTINFYYFP
jgi:hypothetical protein